MDQVVARRAPSEVVEVGPLGDSLGFLLRMAQLQTFGHYFTEMSDLEMKPGAFSVLTVILHNPGIRQGVLAQRLMIKRAHMTKLIRSLERSGYVKRTVPDDDRRSVTLTLTAEGRKFAKRGWLRFMSHEQAPRNSLTPQQQRQLIGLLQIFVGLEETVA
ncbi:MAG: MarR family winged helix-turn-helix transcriptional regulator [Propylenella sp.]